MKTPKEKKVDIAKWYVYAIECEENSVYIGQTKNLEQRWNQHVKGIGARWTKKHKPIQLFYSEECSSFKEAITRERELKKSAGRKFLKKKLGEINQNRVGEIMDNLPKEIITEKEKLKISEKKKK